MTSALTGQEQAPDSHDQVYEEEEGGPFIVSSSRREFAKGEDADDDYEREAFPVTHESVEMGADEFEEEEEED